MPVLENLTLVSHIHVAKALRLAQERAENGGLPPLALDCTAGNGHDTLFLARSIAPAGSVLAFDVQREALASTARRLEQEGFLHKVRLVHAGHETLGDHVPEPYRIDAAMFNLGFLPRSNRQITTAPPTTLAALEALKQRTRPGSICSVHCYTGHPGGDEESGQVASWFQNLHWPAWKILRLEFINKERNKEILFLAERL